MPFLEVLVLVILTVAFLFLKTVPKLKVFMPTEKQEVIFYGLMGSRPAELDIVPYGL